MCPKSCPKQYRPVGYDNTEYGKIRSVLEPVFQAYRENKTFDTNWIKSTKKLKKWKSTTNLCSAQNMPTLPSVSFSFNRGDTHLTLNETISEASIEADLRVINDKIKQKYNVEHDVVVLEATTEDAGDAKLVSDRFKVSIRNEVIIDNYPLDGALVNSVNSLQLFGLGIHFLNTTLEEPGLYSHLVLGIGIVAIVFRLRLRIKKQPLQSTFRQSKRVQPSELTEKQESNQMNIEPTTQQQASYSTAS